jgi:hypothetical protein
VPEGWEVELSKESVTLWVCASETITVKITTSPDARAENTVVITGKSQEDPSVLDSVSLYIKTPQMYGFDIYCIEDIRRGIVFDDSIVYNITVENLGNCGDTLNITLSPYPLPAGWNATIQGEVVGIEGYEHTFSQDDRYKNLTLEITAPNATTGVIGDALALTVSASSQGSGESRSTAEIITTLLRPDLYVQKLAIYNSDLREGDMVIVNATIHSAGVRAREVLVQLFIDGAFIENKTISSIAEDGSAVVSYSWNATAAKAAGAEHSFEIIIDPEDAVNESDERNNAFIRSVYIGIKRPPEPYNWRPVIFVVSIIIICVVLLVIWKRKRKV